MELLLRWLHVGGRGYNHACVQSITHTENLTSMKLKHLNNTLSNGAFADDLICLTNTLPNLQIEPDKLTRYSDWAALQVSGSKTKVTGNLHHSAKTGIFGQNPNNGLKTQLENRVQVQRQHAQFIKSDAPFTYLGVELTMSLDWKDQHTRMTNNLEHKLAGLKESYASPEQALRILNTAIIPSLAYAFPVVPCDFDLLERWDRKIGQLVKSKFGLTMGTSSAMLRENREDFGLGCHSIAVEYHRRNAEALIHSLNHKTERHRSITEKNAQAPNAGFEKTWLLTC